MSQNTTKKPRVRKPPKPDCKAWVQVGEETLVEYLNKPIEIEGVEGYECYVQVALGETLTVHCEGKKGYVDEFVLIADGVIRACENRKNNAFAINQVLHRARGKGKQVAAVYQSDMKVQMRNDKETRFAEEGTKELSKVGSIIVEGWNKPGSDPFAISEEGSNDNKDEETLTFATYDKSHEWYDVNRFVNPKPGHLPPFELSYVHAKNSQSSASGYRKRIEAASTRNTSEWKLAYRFVFNYRSATELHKLGLPDVPVRNPPSGLFAEDPTEDPAEEEATDDEDQAVEPDSENDSEDLEEVVEENPKEKQSEKAKGKKIEKVKEKSAEKPKEKATVKSKETVAEELEENSLEDGNSDTETTMKKKSRSEQPVVAKQTVSGLLNMLASAAAEAAASAIPDLVTAPEAHPENDTPADLEASAEVAEEPVAVSQQKETEEASRKDGEGTTSKAKDNDKASEVTKAIRKTSLQGLKSAPANRVARDQPSSGSGDMLDDVESVQGLSDNEGEDMLVSVDPDQVLPTIETPAKSSTSDERKDESSKAAEVEVSKPVYRPMTPPPSTRKTQSSLDILRAPEYGRRASLPSKSSLKDGRERLHSEPRIYVTSPDYTISHVQRGRAARVSFDERLRGRDTSVNDIAERPTSRVSVISERPQDRAQSEVSDAPTDVADPGEVQMSVKQSQRLSLSTSVKSSVELEASRRFSQASTRSGSMTSEVGNHTLPSPILGRPATPLVVDSQLEGKSEIPAIQARLHLQEQATPHDSPSTQLRQEIADSFNGAPSSAPAGQIVEEERPLTPAATPKVDGDAFMTYPYPSGHQFFSTQPVSLLGKRKADETTGNGSTAESGRPRKSSVPPAARSLGDTLRRQQEENERLEKELKELRHYNATLESIRELREHSRGVKERIDAEKARQAALEAELGQ